MPPSLTVSGVMYCAVTGNRRSISPSPRPRGPSAPGSRPADED